jgi:hypothetical protein
MITARYAAMIIVRSIVLSPLTYIGPMIMNRIIEFWWSWKLKIKERDNFEGFYKFCKDITEPSFKSVSTKLCQEAEITKDKSPFLNALNDFLINMQNDFIHFISAILDSWIYIILAGIILAIILYKLSNALHKDKSEKRQEGTSININGVPTNMGLNNFQNKSDYEMFLIGSKIYQEQQQKLKQRKKLAIDEGKFEVNDEYEDNPFSVLD